MNYRQLEAFRALMETGTVTAASQMLSISQPSLSAHIANLEHDLKLTLFHRRGGRLVPTAESQLLLTEVEHVVKGMGRLRRLATDIRSLQTGRVTVAAYPALAAMLPKFAVEFATKHDGALLELQVHDSLRNSELAATRQVDIALTAMPVGDPAVICELLSRASCVCILPKGHRLAAADAVTPQDLRDEPFIALGREDGSRQAVERVLGQYGVDLNVRFETNRSETACGLVQDGGGIAIIDSHCASAWTDRIAVRPFTANVPCDVYVVRSRQEDSSLLLQAFIEDLRSKLSSL
ncbi:HTH lysR-type domain-containing protein [Paraburkholderia caribensis]|uniref:LysR substrate-binding domain-containing protein n=1 Tax=Paraburkholderia caribensis TaxID=75105 RepID=UPI001CAD54DE|nr:LysR substrate-binding domain-containing protein [Paraburkholderia caribensis]CAG9236723.1 HTH lysR-type domain-containing protein [Paraburkholderia caribensis]